MKLIFTGQKLSLRTIDDIVNSAAKQVGWAVETSTSDTKRTYILSWKGIVRAGLSCDKLGERAIHFDYAGHNFFGTLQRFTTHLQQTALDSLERWPYASGKEVVESFAEHCPYYKTLIPALDKAFERTYHAFTAAWDRRDRIIDAYDAFITTEIDTKVSARQRKGPRAHEIDADTEFWKLTEIPLTVSETDRLLISIRTAHRQMDGAYSFTEALAKYRVLPADLRQTFKHHLREYFFHESARGAEYNATRDKVCMSNLTKHIDSDRCIRETEKTYQLERMLQTLNMYHFMVQIIKEHNQIYSKN